MKKSLLLAWMILSIPILVYCQSRQVTGTVTDEKGEPLYAVSVVQKGTQNGTTTDFKGAFTITVNGASPVLIFSYAGRQTQEISIGTSNTYNISLNSSGQMSEVIVTALGIKKEKRALGYSAQEVSGDALAQTKQTNIVNALRGQVAGVQINSGGGAPGQGSRIIIRGIKSLDPNKDNQPLFVIDGIVMDNSTTTVSTAGSLRGLSNRAADINPDDVESISVLRGGAATALYGQAGSNGVVVITTKSGKAGKMRIGFTTTYGIDEVDKLPEVQSKFSQGFVGATSRVPEYDPTTIFSAWGPTVQEVKAIDPTQNDFLYNHYGRGYMQGNQFRSSLNISGGTENALLSSSFSYFKQNGTIPNSNYQNISARVGGQFKYGKFRIVPSIMFINSGGLRVNADRYNEQLSYWSPRVDVRDYIKPDGTMKGYRDNPIYGTYVNRFRDNVNRLIGNVALTFSPFKWFDIDYKVGMDYAADFRRHAGRGPLGLVGELHFADNGTGFVDEYRINNRIITSNLIGTFKKDWGSKLNTTLRVGNDVRSTDYNRVTASGSDLDIPTLLSLNNAKTRTTSEYLEDYRIVSAFGDLTVGYDNFLFLDVTGRNDWSSSLDLQFNSFFYPSASLSYIFSENFKSMPKWFNYGKLRASYAEIGKDAAPYDNNSYYTSSVITSSGQIAWTRDDKRGDRLLKPERTKTIELGTELRIFQNRLGVDFTWYKLNSRDQIIPVFLSPTSGYTQLITNAGEIENKGIEIVLNGTPVRNKDFTWNTTVNFSRNRNKVVSIKEGLTEIVVGSHFGYVNAGVTLKYVPGYAVGNLYGTTFLRYYAGKPDDKVSFDKSLPMVIANTGSNAGYPVPDLSQRLLGNSQPDWIGGITNTISYKNLRLSFLIETQQGLDRYNQLGNFMAAFGIAKYTEDRTTYKVFPGVLADGSPNTQSVYLGMGKVSGDPRDYGNGYYRNVFRTVSEPFVEDASWTRLRYLSLSYQIPTKFMKSNVIKGASVTFTGNNLILWTKYSGFDPETSSMPAGSNADGFTGFAYPAIRSYLLSINLDF